MQATYIRVRGLVQKVGLRMKIKQIADEMSIAGTAENMDDGSVQIVCEAEEAGIDEMMLRIKEIAEPAVIEDMQVERTSPPTGIKGFTVITGDTQKEMLAALSTGSKAMVTMCKTLSEIRDTTNSINNKMDRSLENEDQTLKLLKDMRGGGLLHASK